MSKTSLKVTWVKNDVNSYTATKGDITVKMDRNDTRYASNYWLADFYKDGRFIGLPWMKGKESKTLRLRHTHVLSCKKQIADILDKHWAYFTGEAQEKEAIEAQIQKDAEDKIKHTDHILQNITYFKELILPSEALTQGSTDVIITVGLKLHSDVQELFDLKTKLFNIIKDHAKAQENWRNLPDDRKSPEVVVGTETNYMTRTVHEKSSYWGYDDTYYVKEPYQSNVYAPNARYIPEPKLDAKAYDLKRQIEQKEKDIAKKARELLKA